MRAGYRYPALIAFAATLVLTGCAGMPFDRGSGEIAQARQAGWKSFRLPAGRFTLFAMEGPSTGGAGVPLEVYIEGDGLSWVSRSRPASDPTPDTPTALEMALAAPPSPKLYVARPCHFYPAGPGNACSVEHWTSHRFGEEVVAGFAQAIEGYRRKTGSKHVRLIGFSGGGTLAILIAARVSAVHQVVTVAGTIDHRRWTAHHEVSPLTGSLDPMRYTDRVSKIAQVHFIGAEDDIVPLSVIQRYRAAIAPGGRSRTWVVPDADHQCCWAQVWPRLHALAVRDLNAVTGANGE